jgi:hypothetical protein
MLSLVMITFVLENTSNYDDHLDLEVPPNEIWVPSLNYMKDGHHLFLIGGFSQIVVTQLLTGECQGTLLASTQHQPLA